VFCSGKVYYDLIDARNKSKDLSVAIVRLEQFYPFPLRSLREVIEKYASATQYAWVQEEPHNMGGWTFVRERLEKLLGDEKELRYIGRTASASPATGSYSVHQKEQVELVSQALSAS
jgi:2-oxoglutarate dehydrogenase complex dehydrogenase (E1) component-like enzyme